MLNFKKVKTYAENRIMNEYSNHYPKEIFDGLVVSVSSGSFGACLLSISYENGNPHKLATVDNKYVANYSAIDSVISDFVVRNYELIAGRYYEEHQKEQKKGLKCVLEIYNDKKKINEIIFTDCERVKSEVVKIVIAEKRRGVRTTYKPKPYSQDMDIVQRWSREEAHTTTDIKYVYHFYNLDY